MTNKHSMSYISKRTFERRYRRFLKRSLKRGDLTLCLCKHVKGSNHADGAVAKLTNDELALIEKVASESGGQAGALILEQITKCQEDRNCQHSDLQEQIIPLVSGKRRL